MEEATVVQATVAGATREVVMDVEATVVVVTVEEVVAEEVMTEEGKEAVAMVVAREVAREAVEMGYPVGLLWDRFGQELVVFRR